MSNKFRSQLKNEKSSPPQVSERIKYLKQKGITATPSMPNKCICFKSSKIPDSYCLDCKYPMYY